MINSYQKNGFRGSSMSGKDTGINVFHVNRSDLKTAFHSSFISIMINTALMLMLLNTPPTSIVFNRPDPRLSIALLHNMNRKWIPLCADIQVEFEHG